MPTMGTVVLSGKLEDGDLSRLADEHARQPADPTDIVLGESPLQIPTSASGLTFHAVLSGEFEIGDRKVSFQVSAQAETSVGAELRTRSISAVQASAAAVAASDGPAVHYAADAAEQALLRLRLAHLTDAGTATIEPASRRSLAALLLEVRLRRDNDKFVLVSLCSGHNAAPSTSSRPAATIHFSLNWTGCVLWKAVTG
jgi:hypothetical protein